MAQQTFLIEDGNIYDSDLYSIEDFEGIVIKLNVDIREDSQVEEGHGMHTVFFTEYNVTSGKLLYVIDGKIDSEAPLDKVQLKIFEDYLIANLNF